MESPRYQVFVSGPMSHRKDLDWNVPAFDRVSEWLRFEHPRWIVVNPVDVFRIRFGPEFLRQPHADYMREAMAALCDPQTRAVVFLPGWRLSKGAYAEAALAYCLGHALFEVQLDGDAPITLKPFIDLPPHEF